MDFLMCEPRFFEVSYKINPWMRMGSALQSTAQVQWEQLVDCIQMCGANVRCVQPIKGLPDMVFTANAGLFIDGRVLLSHFKHPERQRERASYARWFHDAGYDIIDDDDAEYAFEGAGDALFWGDVLVGAHGFRTDKAYYKKIEALGVHQQVHCQLVAPHFYHLDTCFCPLNASLALWWPGAFASDVQAQLATHGDLIAVPEIEAKRFACNSVVIGNHIIVPQGCEQTMAICRARGFDVHACAMSEFLKAGGACKCLTLALN